MRLFSGAFRRPSSLRRMLCQGQGMLSHDVAASGECLSSTTVNSTIPPAVLLVSALLIFVLRGPDESSCSG